MDVGPWAGCGLPVTVRFPADRAVVCSLLGALGVRLLRVCLLRLVGLARDVPHRRRREPILCVARGHLWPVNLDFGQETEAGWPIGADVAEADVARGLLDLERLPRARRDIPTAPDRLPVLAVGRELKFDDAAGPGPGASGRRSPAAARPGRTRR